MEAQSLLERITSFRERLEGTPPLVPSDDPAETASALAQSGPLLSHTLRTIVSTPNTETLPKHYAMRVRQLLQEARGLVTMERELTADPLMVGLARLAASEDSLDPLVTYHCETVAVTETALRTVQAFPDSIDVQLRMSEGVEGMLRTVRDRLIVAKKAMTARRRDFGRIDGLARRLVDLSEGRALSLEWFATLADEILEEARQAVAVRFLHADPLSTQAFPGSVSLPTPARFIAAHALTVAQIVARVVPLDFEWAGRPVIPVVTALLMDAGMLRVPGEVLAKSEPLTPDERRLIDAHAELGAGWIQTCLPQAGPVAEAVRSHHERPDGTGYPDAVAGETIPSLSRLMAACDLYAALASDRAHRPAFDPRSTLTEALQAAEQGQLDRDFAEYLIHLSFHPVGTVVELVDGRIGVVAANHAGRANLRASARPVIAVLTDADAVVLPRPEFVDLAASQRGGILRAVPRPERLQLLAKHYPELCG